MKQVVICPICHGNGKIRTIDECMIADDAPVIKGEGKTICHGCSGKGWIEIGKDDYPPYPYVPYYPPYYPTYPAPYITWCSSDSNYEMKNAR